MTGLKNILVAAAVAVVVALLTTFFLSWFGIGENLASKITASQDELAENSLEGIKAELVDLRGENKLLMSILANMIEKKFPSSVEGDQITPPPMPDKYVSQVLEFFGSPESLSLITPRPTSGGVWYFTKPLFISPELFFINYTNDVDTETLLIRLEFLTPSDLQYNVLWSSMEY